MRIAVVGAGAMGCLFGGALAEAGYEVWLIDVWREHIAALRQRGLIIEQGGVCRQVRVHATTDPAEVGQVDLVIFFTKGVDTDAAVARSGPLWGPDTLALTLQNGLGNVDLIAALVPRERILYGLTTLTSDLKGPGHIAWTFAGEGETFLWSTAGKAPERADAVVEALRKAGIKARFTPETERYIWKKLAINACLNPLCALLGGKVGEVYFLPGVPELCRDIVQEVVDVAQARGITLDFSEAWQYLQEVVRATLQHLPSMAVDIQQGRPTEIAFLNGAVVREGAKAGVATPVNRTIVHLIQGLEALRRRAAGG